MKMMRKIFALLVAVVMTFGMSTSVSAAGTGTITIKNATKGYAYNAYKILDATYKTTETTDEETGDTTTSTSAAYTTKKPAIFEAATDLWKVSKIADADGNYNVQIVDGKTAEDVSAWVEENLEEFTAIPANVGVDANGLAEKAQVKWTGLDFGYYYITSGLGSVVTIDTTTPDAEVYDKNETKPEDPIKTIVSVDGTAVEGLEKTDAHVGSVVGFKIVAKTNNWEDQDKIREKWEVTDTPTNMTINEESIVVKFNDTALTKETDYTAVIAEGKLTISVPMVDDEGNSIFTANTLDKDNTVYGLIPIEITYTATIDAAAAGAPAKNEIPTDSTEVTTYAFKVSKTDGTDPLPGAQFELWSAKDGETSAALTFIDNKDGSYTYDATGSGVTTLDMTTNTTIVIKGLEKDWTYTLKETKVPEGYNQADDKTIEGTSLTEVTADIATLTLAEEEVVNQQGTVLPSTGGIGTTLFYVIGAALVLGSSVLMVSKKRMSAN